MDKLSAMRTFVRVVESGSFSAVADEQGMTQSGVSKQVAALERELRAKLLVRTTRALALTDEGGRYFEQVRRLVADIEEAESALRQGQEALRGHLRVAASVGFGRLHLMPMVKTFLQAHPEVKLDLRLHDGFVDLVEQGIDVSVRIGALPDSGLVAKRIGVSRRMLLAHQDYLVALPAGRRVLDQPEDLVQHECIVYTESQTGNLWTFTPSAEALASNQNSQSVRVSGHLETNSSEVVRAAVLSGMGICYSPTWLFASELASGEVVRLMTDWESPELPIQAVSPPGRQHSAKVKAFVAHLAATMPLQRSL